MTVNLSVAAKFVADQTDLAANLGQSWPVQLQSFLVIMHYKLKKSISELDVKQIFESEIDF